MVVAHAIAHCSWSTLVEKVAAKTV